MQYSIIVYVSLGGDILRYVSLHVVYCASLETDGHFGLRGRRDAVIDRRRVGFGKSGAKGAPEDTLQVGVKSVYVRAFARYFLLLRQSTVVDVQLVEAYQPAL